MKYLFLFAMILSANIAQSQLVTDTEMYKFAAVLNDVNQNVPDPVQFSQKVVTELGISPEQATRINQNIGNLSTSNQAAYNKMQALYKKELAVVEKEKCKVHDMNIHNFYHLKAIYDRDQRMRKMVHEKIKNLKHRSPR